jgi:hypothetical protein
MFSIPKGRSSILTPSFGDCNTIEEVGVVKQAAHTKKQKNHKRLRWKQLFESATIEYANTRTVSRRPVRVFRVMIEVSLCCKMVVPKFHCLPSSSIFIENMKFIAVRKQ